MQHFDPIVQYNINYTCKNVCTKRYKSIIKILIIFIGWWCGRHNGKGMKTNQGMREGRIDRISTLRIIPRRGTMFPMFSSTCSVISSTDMRRCFEQAYRIITVMSDCMCALLLKWSATIDCSVFQCRISYQWRLTFIWNGWPVFPTYWRPHLLHIIKYITVVREIFTCKIFRLLTFHVV